MMKKQLTALLLFILTSISFAQNTSGDTNISNYTVDKNIKYNTQTNASISHRHSIGVNFGSTIFYMLIAPSTVNIIFPSNNPNNLKLQGNFGLDFTYTYRIDNKIDLNIDAGFYAMKTYYDNSKITYNGDVYGIGLSIGARFYFNKEERASGFFLMPKLGGTLFITHNKEYIKESSAYTNRNTYIYDFYISGEIGFRIDLSRSFGINSGLRPFFDISILDIGYSYNHLLRIVPLPRFAIGVLF
ncbi:outer membrane beta-barrel protein [Brachyspira murdochii]|uniref:outer membrane beta-barrel protein n=1 Tax=Brachyspira murdochii TaxID=84378 RepID=UPI0012F4CBEA|nr:outer membrane beta-barrel protein [Brachyspira murdochii]